MKEKESVSRPIIPEKGRSNERLTEKLTQDTEKLAIQQPQKEKKTQKEIRLSTLTESQIMDKLRSVVSSGDPTTIYAKIKKVGQGYLVF